jgi:2-desacetyl-2-hydroxyethyl bacteriochlorophyllide A dehydrogenase
MPETISAVRAIITGEQELHFEEFEVPSAPAGSDVTVRLVRTIISAGTELANYTGLDPDTRTPGRWCTYPWNPGYGGIGEILAVGPDVTRFRPGDRVYGRFQHATHALLDTDSQYCVNVPASLDATTASFVRMGNVAITAFQRAAVSLGDTVAVMGLGLVGNLAGQFFRIAGARTVGIDPAAARRSLAEETGFHATLDPAEYPASWSLGERLKEIGHGAPPRVIVEAVGDTRLIELGIQVVANNGQVILLGTPRAPYETNATRMLDMAHRRGISIVGALEWTIPLLKKQSPGHTTEANAELIFRLIEAGDLKVAPLCSHVLAPEELNEAYQGLLHRKEEYVGVVLDWENHPAPAVDWARQAA